jgi:hypothetical protein
MRIFHEQIEGEDGNCRHMYGSGRLLLL